MRNLNQRGILVVLQTHLVLGFIKEWRLKGILYNYSSKLKLHLCELRQNAHLIN